MRPYRRTGWAGAALAAALLTWDGVGSGAELVAGQPNCAVAAALTDLGAPLWRTRAEISAQKALTILATGSSSTQGVGASGPAMSYPSRLVSELRRLFPKVSINIVNHGQRGLDVSQELAGLNRDLAREHPDLVIWQVGTNALLRRDDLSIEEQLITRQVEEMKRRGVDIVLMDMQYAPRVLARKDWVAMERVIAEIARREGIGYFRRFEIMRAWDQSGEFAPAMLIGRDGLHMTDVSYGCLATQLAQGFAAQWLGQNKLAKSPNRNPAAIAHSIQPVVDGPP